MRLLPHFFTLLMLLYAAASVQAQLAQPADSTHAVPDFDQRVPMRCGAPLVGLFVAESIILGASFYASRPNAYGDKVMGGIWVASAGAMAISVRR